MAHSGSRTDSEAARRRRCAIVGSLFRHARGTDRLSIPKKTVVNPEEEWIVVWFHTASADELMEELASDDEAPTQGTHPAVVYAGLPAVDSLRREAFTLPSVTGRNQLSFGGGS